LPSGSHVGADPNLILYGTWKSLQTQLEAAGLSLVPVTPNLIDIIWEDRPPAPCNIIQPLSVKYTGKNYQFSHLFEDFTIFLVLFYDSVSSLDL
jgi:Xaa-Pro aminopeptidase